jgi:hypothetical protein
MSLTDLSIIELQTLLMEETKKLTFFMREGGTHDEKETQRNIIEGIQRLLGEKSAEKLKA